MRRKPTPIIIVQGAQWGSESKGMVAASLCLRRKVDYAVRTGAVNAGHTVYYKGRKYVNQQLPTGWVNPETVLVLGPGAYVNPFQLVDEITMIEGATGKLPQVLIDFRAGLHLPEHTDRAKASNRHYKIGATSKGCSEAILDRIRLRGSGGRLFKDWVMAEDGTGSSGVEGQPILDYRFCDTVELLHRAYDAGNSILLEGTQGTLLDLYLGPYPYTTHKQCIASQWVTEAGLSPNMEYEVVLVARTYPIRVAGNSGPMPQEIDWPTLACEINHKRVLANMMPLVNKDAIDMFVKEWEDLGKFPYATPEVEASERNRDAIQRLPEPVVTELKKLFEFTTVTKKLRRVARLDMDSLKYSVMLNRPSWIFMTFMNYEFPERWGDKFAGPGYGRFDPKIRQYLSEIESATGIRIGGVSWGPEDDNIETFGYVNSSPVSK